MGKLTWKLVLPLTVISFVTITKWWFGYVDEFGEIFTGFPLPYTCPGWHTSLSLQIFVTELIIDLLTYFAFWYILFFSINRFWNEIKLTRLMTIILLSTSGLVLAGLILLAVNPDNIYMTKCEYDLEIVESGYIFIWQEGPKSWELSKEYKEEN